MGRFDDRVVLITGASAGIGAALAREFARQGAHVALAARREQRLATLAAQIEGLGRRALALRCDVTVDGDVERAVDATVSGLGRLDVAVANAGFGVVGALASLGLDDYRRQFETNVFGVLRTVYASLDALRASGGSLVILGSVAGYVATPRGSPYAMSKYAVRALAEALRHELRPEGVAVTLVSPGFVESEIRQVDNQGVWRHEAADPVPRWLLMPAERAARQIVGAVARRRAELIVTGHAKLAVWLARHTPWLIALALSRGTYRGRSEPARPGPRS